MNLQAQTVIRRHVSTWEVTVRCPGATGVTGMAGVAAQWELSQLCTCRLEPKVVEVFSFNICVFDHHRYHHHDHRRRIYHHHQGYCYKHVWCHVTDSLNI